MPHPTCSQRVHANCETVPVPRDLGSYAECHGLSSHGAYESDHESLSNDVGSLTDAVMSLYTLIDSFISCTEPETETLSIEQQTAEAITTESITDLRL